MINKSVGTKSEGKREAKKKNVLGKPERREQ
jgi:hypothetical protein